MPNNEFMTDKKLGLAVAAGLLLTLGPLGFFLAGAAAAIVIAIVFMLWALNRTGKWIAEKQQLGRLRAEEKIRQERAEWDRLHPLPQPPPPPPPATKQELYHQALAEINALQAPDDYKEALRVKALEAYMG